MIKTVKIILSSLFSLSFWRKPKASKHLIVMPSGAKVLFNNNIVPSKETFVLDLVNYKWLNLFIVINGLIHRREFLFKNNYLFIVLSYIDILQSKYVLTWMDYQINFYRLKAYKNSPVYLAFQSGRRGIESGGLFDILRTMNYSNLSCDYIFCMGDAHAKEYSKYIKCKAISSGLVRGNMIQLGSKDLEKNEVLFVSQYRTKKRNDPFKISDKLIFPWDRIYHSEKILLPLLIEYCNKKSLKLNIISPMASAEEEEENFYDSIIGNLNYNFIKHRAPTSGYLSVDSFKYIIGFDSTLLYESLGRKNRTVFFDTRDLESGPLFWPLDIDPKGPFWTNELNENEVKRLMDFLIVVSHDEWLNCADPIIKKLTSYDNNNSLLRKVFK